MIRTALSRVLLLLCLLAMQNTAFADAQDQPIDLPIRPGTGLNPQALVFENFFGSASGFPVVTFRNGTWSFSSSNGRLLLYSSLTGLQLTSGGPIIPFSNSPRIRMAFFLDASGNLIGGESGPDVALLGAIDIDQDGTIDYTGFLLTAEVTGFTAMEGGTTDAFDVTAMITGGPLASLFDSSELRISIVATNSSFNGDYTVNWKGTPNGKLYGANGAIDIEKATNGVDADDAAAGDAPQIAPGDVVTWTYVVTNTGSTVLENVAVTDDQGVSVSCPQTTLAPMESMVCTASGIAEDVSTTGFTTVLGVCGSIPNTPLYENMGTATGQTMTGQFVQDVDPSHYCNTDAPSIDIEKATNGVDADDPNAGDAPQIGIGNVVTWTYVVTNTGAVDIVNLVVTDDQGVAVSCPQDTLDVGEVIICTASGLADDLQTTGFATVLGLCGSTPNTPLYENFGTVTGMSVAGEFVTDTDPSHYCNPPAPAIDIEKATNGVDADDPNAGDAPQIGIGDIVTWTYVVTNTGNVPLTGVSVIDDQGVSVSCPQDTLNIGETIICTASGLADDLQPGMTTFTTVPGLCGSIPNTPLYANIGTATAMSETGVFVEDEDASHYCNPPAPAIDIEKATNSIDADDPNAGDAPQIGIGDIVTWTYVVTNTGNLPLENVAVIDDQGVSVSCPQDTLGVGEVIICTAAGLADNLQPGMTTFTTVPGLCGSIPNTPLYANIGTATAMSETGVFVEDEDPSHYCNPPAPAIDIEKATNGVDADDPNAGDAPQIGIGDLVTWTYVVTNTGNVPLTGVSVIDDQGVAVSCPQDTLDIGETIICTASGLAVDLQFGMTTVTTVPGLCGSIPNTPLYANIGTATAMSETGVFVEDDDPSHYCNPPAPAIDIEKATNGVDADDPNAGDAPQIGIGDLVTWTYVVTNTGNVPLTGVSVLDDQGVAVSCPQDTLDIGETIICTASGLAVDLQFGMTTVTTVPGLCGSIPNTPLYANIGTATAMSETGVFVEDDDPSHYCNPPAPAIDIEKATNGVDADDPNAGDAPLIAIGSVVSWTYVVTNTGNVPLIDVVVNDDQGVAVSCPQGTLGVGEMFTCTGVGMAVDLQFGMTTFTTVPGLCGGIPNTPLYANIGSVTAQSEVGEFVEDDDPSHYCNPPAPAIDIEKATNGVDADDPNDGTAPAIPVGGTVNWTYVVTNTGNVTLFDVTVLDNRGVAVSCPLSILDPMQVMTCAGSGVSIDLALPTSESIPGLCAGFPNSPMYNNVGSVTGVSAAGEIVEDADPSHYCNPPQPSIDIEKATNGVDADDPNDGTAPQLAIGDTITWTYLVTNTGDVPLSNVGVLDDQGVVVTCPATELAPGDSFTCTGTGTAVDLQPGMTTFTTVPGLCGGIPNTPLYANIGTATAETITGDFVEDTDPSHYCIEPVCEVSVDKTCLIPVAPVGDYVCDTPIDTLTFIWDGASAVRIKAYKGSVGSTLLADIDDIQPGEEISVMGYAGSPNDVFFEIFTAGTSTKIGESKFHLSCSDDEMDGPEDCGMLQGNGKGNDSGLINQWILEGIVDAGGTLDCTTQPLTGSDACTFQAFPASCETGNADFLTFAYTGGGCAASDNDQNDHECTGSIDGTAPVTVTDDGDNVYTLNPGETFTLARNLAKNLTLVNGGGTEFNVLHTSCSQPIVAGDVYGSLTLAQIDGMGVGTDVVYAYTISNNGDNALTSLSANDVPLGPVPGVPSTLAAGASVTLFNSAFITDTTTNTVVVDATDSAGATCSAVDAVTVTIEPPPPCDVDGLGVLDLSDDKVKWELTNNGAFTATIERVTVSFPAQHDGVKEVKLDGAKIYDTDTFGSTLVLESGDLIGDLNKRQIAPGDSVNFEVVFLENYGSNLQGDYEITIDFEEGCSVTFVNTGLPFECTRPIDSLTMIYDGSASVVRVKAWKGPVGSTLLADTTVAVGGEITVSGYAGSPNDVFWELLVGGTKIGESKFHLSCSDSEMNGAEDCGKRQGNGKDNNGSLLNDWLLEGMVDQDGPFDCSNLP